ncbi:MAG: hypothetical protein ABJA74_01255 [Lapillicoccus sp.]
MFGDETSLDGLQRYVVYRWFTDPGSRRIYLPEDHDEHGRTFAADLRVAFARDGAGSPAAAIVKELTESSAEFRRIWADHEVGHRHSRYMRLVHPEVGRVDVHCQTLCDVEQLQGLLVFTAAAGTESHEKLQLLAVLGSQRLGR